MLYSGSQSGATETILPHPDTFGFNGETDRLSPPGAPLTSSPPFHSSDPSDDSTPVAQVLLSRLLGVAPDASELSPIQIAVAESCTGGEVAHRITSVAGSSAYFLGGIVSYSNSSKNQLLGVPLSILDNPGAVSEESARAMVEGVRRVFGADVAVATTGIAGPSGGTARKPVGLVYIAAAGPNATVVAEHHFPGDREAVMSAAATAALELLVETASAALARQRSGPGTAIQDR